MKSPEAPKTIYRRLKNATMVLKQKNSNDLHEYNRISNGTRTSLQAEWISLSTSPIISQSAPKTSPRYSRPDPYNEFSTNYQWQQHYLESVVDSVIPASWTAEFEDGLWIGNNLKAQNGLQRVHTIPETGPGSVCTPEFRQEQTEFQSAWVHVAAFCQARCRVQFPTPLFWEG